MKVRRNLLLTILSSLLLVAACWAQHQTPASDADDAFRIPKFELVGKLAKGFSISDCKYVSGLTCRIHFNGAIPLPSEVFFTELDEHGSQAGARVRLIYPELKSGETGWATFRIRLATPTKIVLQGEWNGAYRNPY
jgi:hypothetical protein